MKHCWNMRLICALCIGSLACGGAHASETDTPKPYTDSHYFVSEWAADEVASAYQNGFIDPLFALGADYTKPVTRAQFAHLSVDLIAAAQGKSFQQLAIDWNMTDQIIAPFVPIASDGESPTDVSDSSADAGEPSGGAEAMPPEDSLVFTYTPRFSDDDTPYVELAARLGIVTGENGLFRPNDPIARFEAAAMLARCLVALGRGSANTQPRMYADAYDMPRWSVASIKLVSGRTDTAGRAVMGGSGSSFHPREPYTIEQAIISLGRTAGSLSIDQIHPDWQNTDGYDEVSLTFTAGGDCTFGRGRDFSYKGSFDEMYDLNGPSYFFSDIRPFFEDDITMVNFEGTLTNAAQPAAKTFVFKGRAEYAQILPAGSIDVVSVANNHSMDYLQRGFDDTVRNLSPYVAVSGYEKMPIVTVKGVRVGFASHVGWSFDHAQKQFIQNAISTLRAQGADLIIFNYHWGVERSYHSDSTQRAIGHYAIDSGADLVIGHHPHVVQEVETYKGKQIAYSLGNLVFGGNFNPTDKNCIIFQQTFTLDLDSRDTVDASYRALPYRVCSVINRNDYHPVAATT